MAYDQSNLENVPPASLASRIAAVVHAKFNGLPNKCKPRSENGNSREWIPMSGVVAVKGTFLLPVSTIWLIVFGYELRIPFRSLQLDVTVSCQLHLFS
jgi:hypothetical protein